MIVLHVSTAKSWRGGEQQLAYLTQGLTTLGIDQVVLCPVGSPLSKRMMEASILVATFSDRGLLDISLARTIHKLCNSKPFDIIHCHDSHAHSAAVLSVYLFGHRTPVVVSRRVDFPVSPHILSRWKYNHPCVHRILCVSEAIRTITAPSIKDTSRLAVVHSGIDLAMYEKRTDPRKLKEELGLKDSDKIVGNLSALADHKDYPTFIRSAAKVIRTDPSVHFIIAGKGDEEKRIRKMIGALKLEKNVHLLGFRSDVVNIMQSLDVFLITSVTEGLGTIVLEAFAAGTPVVATRAGGIPEMVMNEVTGLLADPGDDEALAGATLHLLQHPVLSKQLVQHAYKRVQDFSFRETAQKTLGIYLEVQAETKV
jgi:glycosyltransferase involved in cell wall biosynthesis